MSAGGPTPLERWGRWVIRGRGGRLAGGLMVVLVGATWGVGVFGDLDGGGFDAPASESSRAAARMATVLGVREPDLLVVYTGVGCGVADAAFLRPVASALARGQSHPSVAEVTSAWSTPGGGDPGDAGGAPGGAAAAGLVSADRTATYAVVRLRPEGEDDRVAALAELRGPMTAGGCVHTAFGGPVAFLAEVNAQTERDIVRAEMVSLPILLVLLVVVFGGLVAAPMPLVIGGVAILGAFVATRLLARVTDVSIFAINIITLIGMGMAIDYALFIVSRFREELAAGHPTPTAVCRTLATAGRTVVTSGLIVVSALGTLLMFPQFFLRSMGLGGIAAVLIAMAAALTVLPALLTVVGPRINAGRLPWPGRDPSTRSAPGRQATSGVWARVAGAVMRHPVTYVLGVSAVLLLLAVPFHRITFGGFDERVLPRGAEPRRVAQHLQRGFPASAQAPISVLVSGAGPDQIRGFAAAAAALPHATGVQIVAQRGGDTALSVACDVRPTSRQAQDLVRALRRLPSPEGALVLVGGRTAADVDRLTSLADLLPWMILIIVVAILIMLFVAFDSLLLPLKAIVMNLVSIGASFGVVVWVFQDGHLSQALDFTPMGFIEPTSPILMLAVIFGLSTDYEVFLLSRVREEWERGGDTTGAVAAGLQRTGQIITSAAALLIVVVAGFTAGGIAVIKLIGVGMIVAIVVDASLVRILLVPATMRLLGHWNWWRPGQRRQAALNGDGPTTWAPTSVTR